MNYRLLFMCAVLMLGFAPSAALAAAPSCALHVFTLSGHVEVDKSDTVFVKDSETMFLLWHGQGATSAEDRTGKAVATLGYAMLKPSGTQEYKYTFANDSGEVTCSVELQAGQILVYEDTLSTESTKPTIKGTAYGTKTVKVSLADTEGDVVYASKETKVTKGKWSAKISKELSPGTYTLTVSGEKGLKLATDVVSVTFVVFPKGGATSGTKGGTLSFSMLPLLTGGNAAAGASVPVAYVKVSNVGTTDASIDGFKLVQAGTASTDVVIGFAVNDDKGGSRATIGGTEGYKAFKSSSASVPLKATVTPGQVRVFTIKAILSKTSYTQAGKQLRLNVSGVDTNATAKGAFPLVGTTWTLGY